MNIRKARETFVRYKGALLKLSYEKRHDIIALVIGCPIAGFVFAAFMLLMIGDWK